MGEGGITLKNYTVLFIFALVLKTEILHRVGSAWLGPCDSDIKIRIVDIKKIITNWLSSSWLSRWDKLLETGVGGMFVVFWP